ncbi:MAG: hypothetical protein QW335_08090 [Candidatus Nezhaarchaeales archaeon]
MTKEIVHSKNISVALGAPNRCFKRKEVEVQKLKLTEEIAVLQEERANLQASLKALEDGRGL